MPRRKESLPWAVARRRLRRRRFRTSSCWRTGSAFPWSPRRRGPGCRAGPCLCTVGSSLSHGTDEQDPGGSTGMICWPLWSREASVISSGKLEARGCSIPDPASSRFCTMGGNVAECAGGLRAVGYGVTKRLRPRPRSGAAYGRAHPDRREDRQKRCRVRSHQAYHRLRGHPRRGDEDHRETAAPARDRPGIVRFFPDIEGAARAVSALRQAASSPRRWNSSIARRSGRWKTISRKMFPAELPPCCSLRSMVPPRPRKGSSRRSRRSAGRPAL